MSTPVFWPESPAFRALSVSISDQWVTMVKTDSADLARKLESAGFAVARSPARGDTSYTLCLPGFAEDEVWEGLGVEVTLREMQLTDQQYVSAAGRPISPDRAILVSHTRRLGEADLQALSKGDPDDLLAMLSEGEITAENAELWHGVIGSYASAINQQPENIAAIAAIWRSVAEYVIPVEEEVTSAIIANAGTAVFYVDGAEVKSGRLAFTYFDGDQEVRLINPEPLWVEGAPVAQHIVVSTANISLTPIQATPVAEQFKHPLAISLTTEQLITTYREATTEPFSWNRAIEIYKASSLTAPHIEDIQRIADYQRQRLCTELNSHDQILVPTFNAWGVFRAEVDPAGDIRLRKRGEHIVPSAEAKDYVAAISDYLARRSELTDKNAHWVDTLLANQFDIEPLFRRTEFSESAGPIKDQLLSQLAAMSVDLSSPQERMMSLLRVAVADQLVQLGALRISEREVVWLYRMPNEKYVLSADSVFQIIFSDAANQGSTPEEALALWASQQEDKVAAAAAASRISKGVRALGLMSQGILDDLKARRALDYSERHASEAFIPQIMAQLKAVPSLGGCSDRYLEKLTNNVVERLKKDTPIVLLAIGNRSALIRQVSDGELWGVNNGDRLLSAQIQETDMRSVRGFKKADIAIFDRLQMTDAATYQSVVEVFAQHEEPSLAEADESEDGKRRDKGVVAGFARKDLYSMGSDDLKAALSRMHAKDQVALLKKGALWPKPDFNALMADGMPLNVAIFVNRVRDFIPTSYQNCAGKPEVVAEYFSRMRDMASTLEGMRSLVDAIDVTESYMYQLGFDFYHTMVSRKGPARDLGARITRGNREPIRFLYYANDAKIAADKLDKLIESRTPDVMLEELKTATKAATEKVAQRSLADVPNLEHLNRVGPDYRGGKEEMTEVDLIMSFGFSGVEYGNWTSQKEREQYMVYTFDSFADLADLTGLPNGALSLGGKLGLTFGSRGRGGKRAALAHFEPTNMAIALTRKNGAGSLCHEYFHAIANYFGRMMTGGATTADAAVSSHAMFIRGYDTEKPGEMVGQMRPELMNAFMKLYLAIHSQPNDGVTINSVDDINTSSFLQKADWVKSSEEQDKQDKRKEAYWGTAQELFARAMEAWTIYRLDQLGRSNNYLVNHMRLSEDDKATWKVYPPLAQVKRIDLAARAFFEEIKLEDRLIAHPIGNEMCLPFMYSHNHSVSRIDKETLAVLALQGVNAMLGKELGVSVRVVDSLRSTDGTASGGYNAARSLIMLAADVADKNTINHEIYHAARDLLMTDSEKAMMDTVFSSDTPAMRELERAMSANGMAHLIPFARENSEEAQAYAFELYASGKMDMDKADSSLAAVLDRLLDRLLKIWQGVDDMGISTPSELFEALESGALRDRVGTQLHDTNIYHKEFTAAFG